MYDNEGNIQTTPMNILRTFKMFMKKKYDTVQVDSDSVHRICRERTSTYPKKQTMFLTLPSLWTSYT